MIRRATLVFAMLLALAVTAAAQTSVQWRKDYEAGLKEAKASNKLAMIDFYAEW